MEIQFKRTYIPGRGKRYVMGEIPAMLGYALEIADPRVKMQEGKLNPGEICMLVFGVTPGEYAMKDSDPKALDALADKLLKNIPADRLLGWRIVDLKGTLVQREVKPQTGESIDGGAFLNRLRAKAAQAQAGPVDAQLMEVRRLQQLCASKDAPEAIKQEWLEARKKLGAAILGLETLWAAYDAITGDRWPAVGFDGRVEIFTTARRAQNVLQQIQSRQANVVTWKIHEISGEDIRKFLQGCVADGLLALRVDNGFAAAELNLQDILGEIFVQKNAMLRGILLREVQYGMRWNSYKTANAPENVVQGALESMLTMRNFAWRETGNAKLYALCADGNRDRCVMITGPDGKQKFVTAFTDAERARNFAQKVKGNVRAVEMDFDELAQRSAVCDGLMLDMGFIGYRLMKTDYDKVRDLRGKPPLVVRIQKPETKPEAKPEADFGSLPDPDKFDLPQQPKEEVQEAAAEKKSDTETPNSFLKKLFKKR